MLITVDKLKETYPKFNDIDDELITRRLSVIESAIRKYTNNNFQNRAIRFEASSSNEILNGSNPYLNVEDTLEISNSINSGIYTIKSVDDKRITLEEPIYDTEYNLCTKVVYPIDVIEGAIDLLDWELLKQGKELTGVASESISRHNVSYVQRTNDNTISGYPVELFNFCNQYKKARF